MPCRVARAPRSRDEKPHSPLSPSALPPARSEHGLRPYFYDELTLKDEDGGIKVKLNDIVSVTVKDDRARARRAVAAQRHPAHQPRAAAPRRPAGTATRRRV